MDFRFRNGKKVSFTATAVDVPKLLADIQGLDGRGRTRWNSTIQISDIGYRLVSTPGQRENTGSSRWRRGRCR